MDTHPLIERVRVAQGVLDRFRGQALDYGRFDCAQLAHAVVAGLGGTSPIASARYQTRRGSIRALRALGFETLSAAVDAMGFARIAPAMALPADILAFKSDDRAFDYGLGVALSRDRCLAFVELPDGRGVRAAIGKTPLAEFAWRVL